MRSLSDIPTGGNGGFPPAGKYLCRCINTETWLSPVKKVPAVLLTLTTQDAEYQFTDKVFVTAKALGRLVLVARRLCGMLKDSELPDDDLEAAKQIARYIADNAVGCDAMITVEEQEEKYIVEKGPDIGQSRTVTRSRVPYDGYATIPESSEPEGQDAGANKDDGDIPF